MKKLLVIFFTLVLSSSANGKGGVINYDYIDLLLRHIELATGMPVPTKGMMYYPQVVFVEDKIIHQLVCNKKRTCAAWAATKWNKVFLGPHVDLDTPEGDSILYHELVHVVQFYMHGGNAQTCDQWADREVQAYQLQYRYALSKGHDMGWIIAWTNDIRQRCNYVK